MVRRVPLRLERRGFELVVSRALPLAVRVGAPVGGGGTRVRVRAWVMRVLGMVGVGVVEVGVGADGRGGPGGPDGLAPDDEGDLDRNGLFECGDGGLEGFAVGGVGGVVVLVVGFKSVMCEQWSLG